MPLHPTPPAPRTVAITGGAGDLAQHIATEFRVAGGYSVLAPGRAELDVTRPEDVQAYFSALPQLDVLVCNAGLAENELAPKVTPASWQRQLDVNLRGAFLCTQAAIPLLERSAEGGHIITIGSHTALVGNAGQCAYTAAKAGLIGLTQSLAAELGPRNIRVNCVLPGLLRTRMTRELSALAWDFALNRHVLSRTNEPACAGRFIAFLDSMPHTSGQVFSLDSRLTPWT